MIVPFGKYRRRDAEVLLQDESYCHWLLDQPWFAESHPDLAALVVKRHPPANWSPNYERGWDGAWQEILKCCTPDLYLEACRRVSGCTCDLPLEVCDCGCGRAVGDHAADCPITVQQRRDVARQIEAARQQAERTAARDPQRCMGTRTDGEPCRQTPPRGEAYCHIHRDQQPYDDVREQIATDFLDYLQRH